MLDELLLQLVQYERDPLGYANFAYPWGKPGTDLAKWNGLDIWQEKALSIIGNELQSGNNVVQLAIKSGHGVG